MQADDLLSRSPLADGSLRAYPPLSCEHAADGHLLVADLRGRWTVWEAGWLGSELVFLRGRMRAIQLAASSGSGSGEDHPLAAIDEFAGRVEVPGVTGGLGDHVQQHLTQAGQPPV